MPVLKKNQAVEKLAEGVENAKPNALAEIYAELFPAKPAPRHRSRPTSRSTSAAGLRHWRWRMAARKMMERENVISLKAVQDLFNKFFRDRHKFFRDQLDAWMSRPDAKIRLFGIARADYLTMTDADKHNARDAAMDQFKERFRIIFQRRHDCIHNCDRPRVSPQPLDKGGTVLKVIQDVEFLVNRCDEYMNTEFREFLVGVGCSVATINQAGY